jgi:hypothetical protein
MRGWLDALLVTVAVLAAAAYAFHSLAPRPWRDWVYRKFGFSVATEAGGCGGCGSCEDPKTAARSKEVRIPMKSIGRRSR